MASASTSLMVYLTQYLKIASKGRVSVHSKGSFSGKEFLVFKCTCGDNWHVGMENFDGLLHGGSGTSIPQVLIDWVIKHRHICTTYYASGGQGSCTHCGWPYAAHAESWSSESTEGTIPTKYWAGTTVPFDQPAPKGFFASPQKIKAAPTYSGRKFREELP